MLPNQIPAPPTDMVMSSSYPVVLVVSFTVLALVMAWMAIECRRSGRLLPLFVVIGALVALPLECIYDVNGAVWYPETGHTPLYRLFNISVPLWVLAVYPCYVGAFGYLVYKKIKAGMTATALWKLYLTFLIANLIIEVPVLNTGNIYVYYGPQPFMIFGFPLWWGMTNSLIPVVLGASLSLLDDLLVGPRSLLAIPLVPMAMASAEISAGWPTWVALNSGGGYGITTAAALATAGLAFTMLYFVGAKCCRGIPASRHSPNTGATKLA